VGFDHLASPVFFVATAEDQKNASPLSMDSQVVLPETEKRTIRISHKWLYNHFAPFKKPTLLFYFNMFELKSF
jgi:hypothetical protein